MKTALVLTLLLSAPQAPAVLTAPGEEPPATPEEIVLDPLAGAHPVNHCSVAYTQCPNGGTISCTGHTSCTSGSGWVKCDGVQTNCPTYCTRQCMDGYTFCSSDVGDCKGSGLSWISCDGIFYECGPPRP